MMMSRLHRTLLLVACLCIGAPARAQSAQNNLPPHDLSCAQIVTGALERVEKILEPEKGWFVSYVVETSIKGKILRDTIRITRTDKVLVAVSSAGTLATSGSLQVQSVHAAKSIIVSKPSKELKAMTAKAHSQSLASMKQLIASSVSKGCAPGDSSGTITIETIVKSEPAPKAAYAPTQVMRGNENAQAMLTKPTRALTVVTPEGEFVSLSCYYAQGSPVDFAKVSSVVSRMATASEQQQANEEIDTMITKNGKPARKYSKYSMIDMRNFTN